MTKVIYSFKKTNTFPYNSLTKILFLNLLCVLGLGSNLHLQPFGAQGNIPTNRATRAGLRKVLLLNHMYSFSSPVGNY